MNRDELLAQLRELHAELSAAESVDEETRGVLQQITSDIDLLLDESDSEPGDDSQTLIERFRDVAREFEARHPKISGMIERISDGLAGMGI